MILICPEHLMIRTEKGSWQWSSDMMWQFATDDLDFCVEAYCPQCEKGSIYDRSVVPKALQSSHQ